MELVFKHSKADNLEEFNHERKKRDRFLEVCLSHMRSHLKKLSSDEADEQLAWTKEKEQKWAECRCFTLLEGMEERVFDVLSSELTFGDWAEMLVFPLELAVSTGDKRLAAKLVKAGAAIGSAVHEAVRGRSQEMVDFLMENGGSTGDLNFQGETPLLVAARIGELEMTRWLLSRGARHSVVDAAGVTPLYWAAQCGHADVAEALLAAGADLAVRCTEGELSPLDAAVGFGYTDVMKVLIERGTDVNAAGSEGHTALYWGVYADKAEAIDLLMEAGADAQAKTCAGTFAGLALLHLALHWFKFDAAVALLKNGADTNVRDDEGKTPLHYAAARAGFSGMGRVVNLLLVMGADETIVNKEGQTPMDIVARWHGDRRVRRVGLLLANAAADRAWRRRGFLIMCRAHPDRVRPQRPSGQPRGRRTRRYLGRAQKAKTGARASGSVGGSLVGEGIVGEWGSVAASVVKLEQQDIFRKIVGYL